jgi:8-oxo-dGTP pyrophosphatase MutT (NUDIX family)
MRLDVITRRLAHVGREHGSPDGTPRAAVAAILREAQAERAELFFIRRAERASDPWSRHIAFPGGRHETTDATLLATAIRETREEVGIDLGDAHLVARLPDVPAFTRSQRSGLVVTPFVFAVRGDFPVAPNHEVAETLWVPFSMLAAGEGRSMKRCEWEGRTYDLLASGWSRPRTSSGA